MSTKRCVGFFLFCLDLELFAKIRKTGFLHTCFFELLSITQDLNPKHAFLHIIKWKTCAKIQQKILNSMVVGARQNFQLFEEKKLVS